MVSETRSRGTLAVALVVILNLIPVPYFSTRGIIFYKIEFPSNRGRSYYREVALSNIFIGLFVRFLC